MYKLFLYLHAEWAETNNLTTGIFDFHFQIGDMVRFESLMEKPYFCNECAAVSGRIRKKGLAAIMFDDPLQLEIGDGLYTQGLVRYRMIAASSKVNV